jgi:hypothetical protein
MSVNAFLQLIGFIAAASAKPGLLEKMHAIACDMGSAGP